MEQKYDKIFTNGKIFTSDEAKPYAEAFAVLDGRIAWIGDQDDPEIQNGCPIDLGGRRVLPGILDNHMHPLFLADTIEQIACLPPEVHSIAELKEKIRERAAETKAGDWIIGWGYDEGKFAEKRAPLRQDLDEAAPDHPVMIMRTCYHIASVNSKALELAGITKDTADPVGGKIDRDENGQATGILRETAKSLAAELVPAKSEEDMAEALVKMGKKLLSRGVTGIADSSGRIGEFDCYNVYKKAAQKGLRQRVAIYYRWNYICKNPMPVPKERKNTADQIYVGGVKVIGDGSVSGQTAWCDQPYVGTESCGFPVATQEEILAAGAFAEEQEIQLKYHAMGAKAIDLAVDNFYEKESWMKDGRPYVRIEHSAMPTEQAMERCAASGIAMTVQPVFLYSEIESYLTNIGAERTKQTYPVKTMLEKGVLTAFSSDAPATAWADPANPFVGMYGAVNRRAYDGTDTGQEEGVDLETAIRLYTAESQKVLGMVDTGCLAVGCHADFIVLDRDLLEMPPQELAEVLVEEVFMDGEKVYGKDDK